MAVGDITASLESISPGSSMTIQPGSGIQWTIHNIFHEDAIEIYICSTTYPNGFKFEAETGFGVFAYYVFEITGIVYLKVKNVAGTSKLIGYSGRVV